MVLCSWDSLFSTAVITNNGVRVLIFRRAFKGLGFNAEFQIAKGIMYTPTAAFRAKRGDSSAHLESNLQAGLALPCWYLYLRVDLEFKDVGFKV